MRLNLGCHFDNQLYLIRCAAQDDVNQGVDVGDVDFSVTVHVGSNSVIISAQDDVDGGVYISNIDLKVTIHVAQEYIFHNLPEIGVPALIGLAE